VRVPHRFDGGPRNWAFGADNEWTSNEAVPEALSPRNESGWRGFGGPLRGGERRRLHASLTERGGLDGHLAFDRAVGPSPGGEQFSALRSWATADDPCYTEVTAGQAERMQNAWRFWRA